MSDCSTPTDGEVLEAWAAHNTPDLPTALDLVAAYDAFKRWLAEHDAKVRAEALWEAAARLETDFGERIPGGVVLSTPSSRRIRAYAEELRQEAGLK